MAVVKIVRVTRTYEVPVLPEYGDTEDGIVARADVTDAAFVEARSILPDYVAEDSPAAEALRDIAGYEKSAQKRAETVEETK